MVLGISADDTASHRKFRAKEGLPYRLLADTDHAVCIAYGVWQEKSFMGRRFWGIARTTYVIAPDGTVARVFQKVNPDGHANDVAAALEAIK